MAQADQKTNKIAVVFPGIGYHLDMPLLYYGRDLLREAGYEECIQVAYMHPGEIRIPGNMGDMEEAFRILYARAKERLFEVDWSGYDEVVFLSKSIGTAIAAAYAEEMGLNAKKIRHVLYTPLEHTFSFHPQNAIGFIGTKDSHCVTDTVTKLADQQGIPMLVYDRANHSLETGDVLHDLGILRDVMEKTKLFLQNT
ncbi:MAG: alpha/beta hydrolase [Lachnospiraceae bacterium]|nr:alpha/beta hydrolase [Lachnospiraceae bacterium]